MSCLADTGLLFGFTSLIKGLACSPGSWLLFSADLDNLTSTLLHIRNPSACHNYCGGVVTGEDTYFPLNDQILLGKGPFILAKGHCLGAVLGCTPQKLRNVIASFRSCLLGISFCLHKASIHISIGTETEAYACV